MFEGYKPSFIMPEIVGILTVARFLGVYWVFIPPLGNFARKRKYLANRFSQMKICKIALSTNIHLRKHESQISKTLCLIISFGWNSGGIGMKYGFEIERILLVTHGGWHNDTICTIERKTRNV